VGIGEVWNVLRWAWRYKGHRSRVTLRVPGLGWFEACRSCKGITVHDAQRGQVWSTCPAVVDLLRLRGEASLPRARTVQR
jgi:hypothetical protein